jgi:ribosomal protein S18 acetylase RimI-like enzyme
MGFGFNFTVGGVELLDDIGLMWEKLNEHHAARSNHFSDVFAENTFAKRKQSILSHSERGLHVIIALNEEGERAGYCVSTVNRLRVGEIDSLYVRPEFRQTGLGEVLVKRSIDWLNAQDVSRIFLEVAEGNEEVYGFYARFGFYPAKIILEQKK